MRMNDYQLTSSKTAIYPTTTAIEGLNYTVLGLCGETGEVANKLKKVLRGDMALDKARASLIDELGDCLWYIAATARELDCSLEDVAQLNLLKLSSRKARESLRGNGDER